MQHATERCGAPSETFQNPANNKQSNGVIFWQAIDSVRKYEYFLAPNIQFRRLSQLFVLIVGKIVRLSQE